MVPGARCQVLGASQSPNWFYRAKKLLRHLNAELAVYSERFKSILEINCMELGCLELTCLEFNCLKLYFNNMCQRSLGFDCVWSQAQTWFRRKRKSRERSQMECLEKSLPGNPYIYLNFQKHIFVFLDLRAQKHI